MTYRVDSSGFPVPSFPPEVEALAERIADRMFDTGRRTFDEAVAEIVGHADWALSLPVDQLAECIIHARVLVGQHGMMTWQTDIGPAVPKSGEVKQAADAHDHATAAALLAGASG